MNKIFSRLNKMQLVYALENEPKEYTHSIFLAGPTPRDNTKSWREDAIKLLNKYNYKGIVYIPEQRNGYKQKEYYNQIDWELKMMNKADIIMFYIPRDIDNNLLGLTTNCEYGRWENSGKIVIGFPKNSDNNTYIEICFKQLNNEIYNTLEDTIIATINKFNEDKFNPSLRKGTETDVPLYIWNTKEFQDWYNNQKNLGNELRNAKVNYVFTMPKMQKVFLWILQVNVYIKDEDRIKSNEFILSRTNICSAVLFYKPEVPLHLSNDDYIHAIENNILDTEIVIVKEFRSPVNNRTSYIYEIPGGSSMKEEDNIDVIYDELLEECNLDIDKKRIKFHKARQLMGTLSIHKSYCYYVELNKEEIEDIKKLKGQAFGIIEDTEQTYVEVYKARDLISNNLLDWSNIGMIMEILNK